MEIPKCHCCGQQDWEVKGNVNEKHEPIDFVCRRCRFYAKVDEVFKLREVLSVMCREGR